MKTPRELFDENQGLVGYTLSRLGIPRALEDDARQAGFVGLWHACSRADEQVAGFATYAILCVRGEILRFLPKHRFVWIPNWVEGQARQEAKERTRLADMPDLPDVYDRYDRVTQAADAAMDAEVLLRHLNARERLVVLGRMADRELRDIGEELGVSRQRVSQIEQRAMDRLFSLRGALTEKSA